MTAVLLWANVPERKRLTIALLRKFAEARPWVSTYALRLAESSAYCPAAVISIIDPRYYQPCAVRTSNGAMCARHGKRGLWALTRAERRARDAADIKKGSSERLEQLLIEALTAIRDQLNCAQGEQLEERAKIGA